MSEAVAAVSSTAVTRAATSAEAAHVVRSTVPSVSRTEGLPSPSSRTRRTQRGAQVPLGRARRVDDGNVVAQPHARAAVHRRDVHLVGDARLARRRERSQRQRLQFRRVLAVWEHHVPEPVAPSRPRRRGAPTPGGAASSPTQLAPPFTEPKVSRLVNPPVGAPASS